MVVVPLLAFGPAERTAPTHWAFVVGISDYINFDDVEGGDLPGAEHDARAIRDALIGRWGFPEKNVRLLLNRDATRAAIEAGITKWLATRARPGDNIVIFYAGHGSQMWDESGDEDDGLDETIAPTDVLPTSTEFDISDDELNQWLSALPTRNVVVVLDNCNSGTGTRSVTPFSRARRLGRDINDVPKPPTISRRALPGQTDETGLDAGQVRVLELAAAQPDQAAVDAYFPGGDGAEPFHGGAFTTFLVQQLWRAPSDATYQQVFREVYEAMKRNRFQQQPHLSEDVELKSSPLFFVEGGTTATAEAALPVTAVRGGQVELGGGVALGITTGSVFETPGGARMVVEGVRTDRASARVVQGSAHEGDRAKMVGYRYAHSPVLVNVSGVDSHTIEMLGAALRNDEAVRLVEDPDAFSHLILRRRGDRLRIVGSDGFVRTDSIPLGEEGIARVVSALRQEAIGKQLADMENPGQTFGVSLALSDGRTRFGIGEFISFHATSERDGYLTLVDLSTDGTVTLLYPNPYQTQAHISAGETVSLPSEEMDFQFIVQPPSGRGMVRAFVTAEPLPLEFNQQDWATGGEDFARQISDALKKASGPAPGSPDAVRLDTWGTASLVYDIHN